MDGVWLVPLALVAPSPVFALQTHGGEGPYLHQMAHLLFLAAMVLFAWRIQQSRLIVHRPWRLMAAGAWLLALWNLWAFVGHFIEDAMPATSLLQEPGQAVPWLALVSWREVAYFVVKMDHLLAVPAIFCFYFGMRGIYRSIRQPPSPTGRGGA